MKKSVLLLTIAIIAFSCKPKLSIQKSDLASANLKGNVWKVSRITNETGKTCGCVLKTDCSQSEYVYNEKGNLSVFYTVDENKVTNDSTVYSYNRRGFCSEIARFSFNKSVGKEVPVVRAGKVAGYKIYNVDGTLESTSDYVYSGDEISVEKTVDNDGKPISTIEKEFVNGQLISQTEKDSNGNVKSISKYKRNGTNDVEECLTMVSKDNKEFKLTYEYEYDDAGNWIKQTQYYEGEIINIIIRNIEYFKS